MPDAAEQLQRLHQAGFDFQTYDRFPKTIGVFRGDCVVMLTATPEGLHILGSAGWKMGEVMGVLTSIQGNQVFQAKSEVIEATPERLERLRRFIKDVEKVLSP